MELNQLRTFVTVAEEGHLTRAAERLFTSQPAVSAQLKSLEETLGVKLFDRTPKGMVLSPHGEALLSQARATLTSAGAIMETAKSLHGQVAGKLAIGINSDLAFLRIPELLSTCREHYPGIGLSLINSMSADIILDVRKGKLDAGFFFGPCKSADLHCVPLSEFATAIVAPAAWRDRVLQAELSTLAQLPWIYTTERCPFFALKEQLFSGCEHPPSKSLFVDSEESIRTLIKSGAGVSLLRDDDAEKAEAEGWGIRWQGSTPSCPLSVAVPQRRVKEPVIQAWLTALAKCWQLHQGNQAREVI